MKPTAYIVKQVGLSEYTEILRTKKQAVEAARDMSWHPGRVTVTPLYAGDSVDAAKFLKRRRK
jgi:hypothetical protein